MAFSISRPFYAFLDLDTFNSRKLSTTWPATHPKPISQSSAKGVAAKEPKRGSINSQLTTVVPRGHHLAYSWRSGAKRGEGEEQVGLVTSSLCLIMAPGPRDIERANIQLLSIQLPLCAGPPVQTAFSLEPPVNEDPLPGLACIRHALLRPLCRKKAAICLVKRLSSCSDMAPEPAKPGWIATGCCTPGLMDGHCTCNPSTMPVQSNASSIIQYV